MNGFERRKEQKKEKILKAALELFSQHGFNKSSISEIAQKADVSPVTIYNHFGSKDGLIQESIKMLGKDMLNRYRGVINGDGTFADKLETIVFDKIGVAVQFRGELGEVIIRGENSAFIDESLMKDAIEITIALFDAGKREGYISKDISNEAIIAYIEILRIGIASSNQLKKNKHIYPRLVEELNQLFLYGLIDTGDRKEFKEAKNKANL